MALPKSKTQVYLLSVFLCFCLAVDWLLRNNGALLERHSTLPAKQRGWEPGDSEDSKPTFFHIVANSDADVDRQSTMISQTYKPTSEGAADSPTKKPRNLKELNWNRETLTRAPRPPGYKYANISRTIKVMNWNDRNMTKGMRNIDFSSCPPEYNNCVETTDPTEADIFLFSPPTMGRVPKRKPGDIWVMACRETPAAVSYLPILKTTGVVDQFNWTFSVLSDSTWQALYGVIIPQQPPVKDYHQIFQQKKFDVAWFVSHCHIQSRRGEYVDRMSKVVPVHIYGNCGTLRCGKHGAAMGGEKETCMGLLERKYKFYLSFENSMCRDYLTEKIFEMYKVDVIPVVRGGANYSEHLPDGTYINSADFSSPEELGQYLYDLAGDEKRYTEILRRKHRFTKRGSSLNLNCEICKKAHSNPEPQWYEDIWDFAGQDRNCWEPSDM